LTRVWAERGSRPPAPRDQRHEWAYIFGAVCPRRDIGAALVLPYANAQAMNLHLEEISCQVTQGSHAVLLLDGAGWHQTGGKLRVPKNVSLSSAALFSRTEPGGEHLAVPSPEPPRQPCLRELRRHRRRMLRRMECPRCRTGPHHLHHDTRLGIGHSLMPLVLAHFSGAPKSLNCRSPRS